MELRCRLRKHDLVYRWHGSIVGPISVRRSHCLRCGRTIVQIWGIS